MKGTKVEIGRREFLLAAGAAGAGLVLAFAIPGCRRHYSAEEKEFSPNAYLSISPEGAVTVTIPKVEMGQGVRTSLAMLVAEELGVDLASVNVVQADAGRQYGNQTTEGSSSVRDCWDVLRKAGAVGREMLVAAAARRWGVAPATCSAAHGVVSHGTTGRRISYGGLAQAASELPVPDVVHLKQPGDYSLIGRATGLLHTPDVVDGRAKYSVDVILPGMLYAAIVRCPVIGGTIKRFDASRASTLPGVRRVIEMKPTGPPDNVGAGVAVLADSTWGALRARNALEIEWNEGTRATLDSNTIDAMFRERLDDAGHVVRHEGDAERALSRSARTLEATYEVPFLAHAAIEPLTCTAWVHDGICEIWGPTQAPGQALKAAYRYVGPLPELVMRAISKVTGWLPGDVKVHVPLLGGAFGRGLEHDFVVEAVILSKEAGAPVKVQWTREDVMQHDFYRPESVQRIRGGLDARGVITAWSHRIVGPSRFAQHGGSPAPVLEAQGIVDLPYAVPNVHAEFVLADPGIPVGAWRAVALTQNVFCCESFMDEAALAAGIDPLEFRLRHLERFPRMAQVLRIAAQKSGWGGPLPPGQGRGLACSGLGDTCVAHVVTLVLNGDEEPRIDRVWSVIDCGLAVNPGTIVAQVEGSVMFGLSAVLKEEITIRSGRVEQGNFDDFELIRMDEAPPVDVTVVPSTSNPSGVGEPAVPPIMPAVTNAWFAATGQRIRRLPLRQGRRVKA